MIITMGLNGRAFTMALAIAFLAGCGGARVGGMGTVPTGATTPIQARSHSTTIGGALIYAVGGCGGTCVLSYADGTFIQALPTGGSAICSDNNGNVFISDDDQVVEYAHGASSPIATLSVPGHIAQGCAVDSGTNNLAVVFKGSSSDLAVFSNEKGSPALYSTGIGSEYCGYDNQGSLFVDGYYQSGYALAELTKNGSSFSILPAPASVGPPGQVQWDGNHITYESLSGGNAKLSRLSVNGSQVSVVGTTPLKGVPRKLTQSWLYSGKLLVPFNTRGSHVNLIGEWKYPKGVRPKYVIKKIDSYRKKTINFQGVTISVAP